MAASSIGQSSLTVTDTPLAPRHRSLGTAAAAAFGAQLAAAALSLIHVVVMARVLGPEGRGAVVFLTSLAGLTGFAATISAHESLANQANRHPQHRASLITNSLALAAGLGGVGGLLFFTAVRLTGLLAAEIDTVALAAAATALPGFVLFSYLMYLTRAAHAFRIANVAILVVPTWILVLDGAAAAAGLLDVRVAAIVWAGGHYAGCVVLLRHLVRRTGFGPLDMPLLTDALRFGVRAHGAGLLNSGSYRIDHWLLGVLAGAGPLGIYSAAVAWFEGLFLIPGACAAVARPSIVEAEDEEAASRADAALHLALAGVVIVGVGLFIAAPFLCSALYGPAFAPAATSLRLLIPGAVGISLLKVLGGGLTARGHPELETAGVAAGFLVGIVLYTVLIPRYGAPGAALASSFAYSVAGLATAIVFSRTMRRPLVGTLPGRRTTAAALTSVVSAVTRKR